MSPAKRTGKRNSESEFNHTLVPSGNSSIYSPPRGTNSVLIPAVRVSATGSPIARYTIFFPSVTTFIPGKSNFTSSFSSKFKALPLAITNRAFPPPGTIPALTTTGCSPSNHEATPKYPPINRGNTRTAA